MRRTNKMGKKLLRITSMALVVCMTVSSLNVSVYGVQEGAVDAATVTELEAESYAESNDDVSSVNKADEEAAAGDNAGATNGDTSGTDTEDSTESATDPSEELGTDALTEETDTESEADIEDDLADIEAEDSDFADEEEVSLEADDDTEVSIKTFSIKDVPSGKPETAGTNKLKYSKSYKLEYSLTMSNGKTAQVVTEEYAKKNFDSVDDDTVIIRLVSDDSSVLEISKLYNTINANDAVGTTTVTATAYLKKDAALVDGKIVVDEDKTLSADKEIQVVYPTGELLELWGRYFISFDGETRYSGWAKKGSGNKYTQTTDKVTGNYYFLGGNDYIDTDNSTPCSEDFPGRQKVKTVEDSSSDVTLSNKKAGDLAKNCNVWINNSALYQFDENGKCVKFWNRLKSIDIADKDGNLIGDEGISFAQGDTVKISVIYHPEDENVYSGDLVENYAVTFTTSDPAAVTVPKDSISYVKSKDSDGNNILTCTADVVAIGYTVASVTITAESGDEDNKYKAYYETPGDETSVKNYLKTLVTVNTTYAKGWNVIDGFTYYIKDDGTPYTEGWKTMNGGAKYYFYTPTDVSKGIAPAGAKAGAMATGVVLLPTEEDSSKTAYYRFGDDGRLVSTIVKSGWQNTIDGSSYYFDRSGNMVKNTVMNIEGKKYLFDAEGRCLKNGVYKVNGKVYYVNKSGLLVTGWQTVAISSQTDEVLNTSGQTKKFYFDPATGELKTGFVTISGKTYYLCEKTFGGFYVGQVCKGYVELDKTENTGNVPATSETVPGFYYLDSNGVIKTGWQKFKADGKTYSWHYFALNGGKELAFEETKAADGKSYYRSVSEGGIVKNYYFPNNGTPYIYKENGAGKAVKSNLYYQDTETEKYYYINSNGSLVKGWLRFKADDVNYSWHYFSTSDGAEIEFGDGDVATAADGKSKWRVITEDENEKYYYFPSDTSVAKGFKDLTGTPVFNDGVKRRYYFDGTYGYMTVGEFTVNGKSYYAEEASDNNNYGSVYRNSWKDFNDDADGSTVERTCYYNGDGKRVSGWNDLKARDDASITAKKRFYFDTSGCLMTGDMVVGGKRYLLCDTATPGLRAKGELLKSYYGTTDGKGTKDAEGDSKDYYLTNGSGVILTGWQRFKADGTNYSWHLFDHNNGNEIIDDDGDSIDITLSKVENGKLEVWASVRFKQGSGVSAHYVTNKYYFKNNKLMTGWQTIKDGEGVSHKYYFDKTTGMLQSGMTVAGKTVYYLTEEGERSGAGIIAVNGKYMYLNKNGEARKGWFTADGNKYYGDSVTGYLSTGFDRIDGKLYYFRDTKAVAGQMQTGFFTISNSGQSYYDTEGSNIYYADDKGVVASSGWRTITHNPKVSDSQKWSYYFNPKVTGRNADGEDICGEVVTGDVIIKDDGTVEKYDADSGHDINEMYSFDERTGARSKVVLYFHGGAYKDSLTGSDYKNQYNTMMSIATHMNTDKLLSTPSDKMILAGYTDLSKYGISGYGKGFPLAASKNVPEESDIYEDEKGFDVVRYDAATDSYVSGSDGAVDIGDIEVFAEGLYAAVMSKFGARNVVLMGASSGGTIALSCLMNAANHGGAQPAETILYCPWLDASMSNGNAKKYSSGGVDYKSLLYAGARVTRDATYQNPETKKYVYAGDTVKGPGAKSQAAWFASPILAGNEPNYAGITSKVTLYTGTSDPCYPDISNFVSAAKGAGASVKLNKYTGSGHGYVFSGSSSAKKTVLNTAWAIMTESGK